jgi:hypothetical protein
MTLNGLDGQRNNTIHIRPYQYHIGDLSACVLGHESKQTLKYASWAKCLFANGTQLKRPAYFWAKAWDASEVGVWEEYGSVNVTGVP